MATYYHITTSDRRFSISVNGLVGGQNANLDFDAEQEGRPQNNTVFFVKYNEKAHMDSLRNKRVDEQASANNKKAIDVLCNIMTRCEEINKQIKKARGAAAAAAPAPEYISEPLVDRDGFKLKEVPKYISALVVKQPFALKLKQVRNREEGDLALCEVDIYKYVDHDNIIEKHYLEGEYKIKIEENDPLYNFNYPKQGAEPGVRAAKIPPGKFTLTTPGRVRASKFHRPEVFDMLLNSERECHTFYQSSMKKMPPHPDVRVRTSERGYHDDLARIYYTT